MAKKEKIEEMKFVARLRQSEDLRAIKFTDPGRRGAPDRLVLLPSGICVFFEFKRDDEKPRPEQIAYHNWLKSLDHGVYTVYTAEEALLTVRRLLGDYSACPWG